MEIKIRELTTNQEVLNSARTTVWREDLMKEIYDSNKRCKR